MALSLITSSNLPQGWDSDDRKDLKELLNQIITNVNAIEAWGTALATKLNADGGVTDTNYDTTPV